MTAPSMCTCSECSRVFDKRQTTGWGRGKCPACYRRSRPDRAGQAPRVDVGVTREAKVGLTAELDAWLSRRAAKLGTTEAELIRQALTAAMRRSRE